MEHAVDRVRGEEIRDQRPVADVALHEREAGLAPRRLEVLDRARVGEGVEHDDPMPARQGEIGEMTPDEPRAAGDRAA